MEQDASTPVSSSPAATQKTQPKAVEAAPTTVEAPPAPVVSMQVEPEAPSSSSMDMSQTVMSTTSNTIESAHDEDSMLLMTILKEHSDKDERIMSTNEFQVTTTTTAENDPSQDAPVMPLPPLSIATTGVDNEDAHMMGMVSSDETSSNDSTTSGESAEEAAASMMPEFSIPNPLAALVDIPETTAPAIANPPTKIMSLFGKPVTLSS